MMASAFCSQPCGASSGLADLRLHEGKSTNKSWGRTEYLLPLPDSTLGGSIVLWIRPCGYDYTEKLRSKIQVNGPTW